tara:strand:- start:28008 stop:28766 length:759 start_codon:yes stop_codon:yes gene_type:complete
MNLISKLFPRHRINRIKNLPIYFLYHLNFKIINFLKSEYNNFFDSSHAKKMKINISNNFIDEANEDLRKKNRDYFKKDKGSFLYYDYQTDYFNQVNLAWNYNKKKYYNFFENNFGDITRNIYHGYNYRIEHIFLYETINKNKKESYNLNSKFHLDGDLPGALKVLVYLCDVNDDNGPFVYKYNNEEIKVRGETGTSVIFQQNKCLHAASNTILNKRIAISFLIYPTLNKKLIELDTKPINAMCSLNPFTKYT